MNFKIRIPTLRKMGNPKFIIECTIMFFCIMGTLQLLGAPHVIEYFLDVMCMLLLINMVNGKKINKALSNPVIFFQVALIFLGGTIAAASFQSPVLLLWSLRNLGRFIIFFGACVCYLNYEDYERIFSKLNVLFYANFALVIIEYFVLGLSDDAIGGLFGATQTTNGDLNIFLLVMTIYYVVKWDNGEKKTLSLITVLLFDIIICVLAELKFFFFELVGIYALTFVINRVMVKRRKLPFKWIAIFFICVVLLLSGVTYLGKVYAHWDGFFTLEKILEEITREGGYTNRGDINRLTFISTINERVFNQSFINRLFGVGLGGAEFSGTSELLTSHFFLQYEYLHYFYFSLSWMYVECGYIGMVLYLMSFGIAIYRGVKRLVRNRKIKNDMLLVGSMTACMSVLLLIYNQSMRLPSAFLVYFAIASIFVGKREKI